MFNRLTFCRIVKKSLMGLLRLVSYGILVMLLLILGPTIEGKLYPVISDVKIVSVVRSDDSLLVSFSGNKQRDCSIVSIEALVKNDSGVYVHGNVSYKESFTSNGQDHPHNSPEGIQSFGPLRVSPTGTALILEAHHQCHGLWVTNTPLIIWTAPSK